MDYCSSIQVSHLWLRLQPLYCPRLWILAESWSMQQSVLRTAAWVTTAAAAFAATRCNIRYPMWAPLLLNTAVSAVLSSAVEATVRARMALKAPSLGGTTSCAVGNRSDLL